MAFLHAHYVEAEENNTFLLDLAVVTAGERPCVPHARGQLLSEVDVAQTDVLRLQMTQRLKGILGASPDQWLAAANPGAGYTEMAEEQAETIRSPSKASVEIFELFHESAGQARLLWSADELCLARIGEYCDRDLVKFDELRLLA